MVPISGFTGTIPEPTLATLQDLIRTGSSPPPAVADDDRAIIVYIPLQGLTAAAVLSCSAAAIPVTGRSPEDDGHR